MVEQATQHIPSLIKKYGDDQLSKELSQKLTNEQMEFQDLLNILDLQPTNYLPQLKILQTQEQTSDVQEQIQGIMDVQQLHKNFLEIKVQLQGRIACIMLNKWKQEQGARFTLYDLQNTMKQYQSDQQKTEFLKGINSIFEELIRNQTELSLLMASIDDMQPINIDHKDDHLQLEIEFRIQCDQNQIPPNSFSSHQDDLQGPMSADKQLINGLQDQVRKIRELVYGSEVEHSEQQPKTNYESFQQAKENYQRQIGLPKGFELSLLKAIVLLQIKIQQPPTLMYSDIDGINIDNINQQIIECLQDLQQEFANQNTPQHLAKLLLFDQDSISTLQKTMETLSIIKQGLIIFNFQEFFFLIININDAQTKLTDQKVFMFLGQTGSGKSTTLQYLGGSTMRLKQIDGMPTIVPVDYQFQELKKVIVSHYSRSQTMFVTPIEIDLQKIGYFSKKKVMIADTPGFGDSRGIELCLSNSLGIIKSIKNASSIVPIVLLSVKDFGSRNIMLKQHIKKLSLMIKNPLDSFEQFHIFFTHTDNTKSIKQKNIDMKAIFEDYLKEENLQSDERADLSFLGVLELILQKIVKNQVFYINPLDQDPIGVWEKLLKLDPIETPSDIFLIPKSNDSIKQVVQQFDIHTKTIVQSLKHGNISMAIYKYQELHDFTSIFKADENITNKLEQVKQSIKKVFIEIINKSKTHIKDWFQQMDQNNSELDKFYQNVKESEIIQTFNEKFLENDSTLGLEQIFAQVVQIVEKHFQSLPKNNLCDFRWSNFMKKCHSLSQNFPSNLQTLYQTYATYYDRQFKIIIDNVQGAIDNLSTLMKNQSPSSSSAQRSAGYLQRRGHFVFQTNDNRSDNNYISDSDSSNEEAKHGPLSLELSDIPSNKIHSEREIAMNIIQLLKIADLEIGEVSLKAIELFKELSVLLEFELNSIKEKKLSFVQFEQVLDEEEDDEFTLESQNTLTSQSFEDSQAELRNRLILTQELSLNFDVYLQNYINILSNLKSHLDPIHNSIKPLRVIIIKLQREIGGILIMQFQYNKDQIKQYIKEINVQDNFDNGFRIQKLYNQINQIRRVQSIRFKTEAEFQRLSRGMIDLVKKQQINVKNLLQAISNGNHQTSKRRQLYNLNESFVQLRKLYWICDDDPCYLEEVKQNIQEQLKNIQEDMEEEFAKYNINLGLHSNLAYVSQFLTQINIFQQLATENNMILQQSNFGKWKNQFILVLEHIQKMIKDLQDNLTAPFINSTNVEQISNMLLYLQALTQHQSIFDQLNTSYINIEDAQTSLLVCTEKQRSNLKEFIIKTLLELEQFFSGSDHSYYPSRSLMISQSLLSDELENPFQKKQKIQQIDDFMIILLEFQTIFDDQMKVGFKQSTKSIIKEITTEFEEFQAKCKEELNNHSIERVQINKKILSIVKDLVKLDKYIEDQESKFKTLKIQQQNMAQNQKDMQIEGLKELLDNNQYEQFKYALEETDNHTLQKGKELLICLACEKWENQQINRCSRLLLK